MEKPSRFLANSSTALEQLRGLINQHESTPGTPLPTERELSETLGVGRREVRRALDVLEEEGRIWRKQGKGTFIGPSAPVEPLALQGIGSANQPSGSHGSSSSARTRLSPACGTACHQGKPRAYAAHAGTH